MSCLMCSQELTWLRAVRGHSFCCSEHRKAYVRETHNFMLERLIEERDRILGPCSNQSALAHCHAHEHGIEYAVACPA